MTTATEAVSFRWRTGIGAFFSKKIDFEVAHAEIERIHREHGGSATPKDVVDAARGRSAPLHACFEWNDAEAAEKYREDTARQLMRSIELVITVDGGKDPVTGPAYVSVNAGMGDEDSDTELEITGRRYMSSLKAGRVPDLHAQMVDQCVAQIDALKRRLQVLRLFPSLIEAIDAELAKHKRRKGGKRQ